MASQEGREGGRDKPRREHKRARGLAVGRGSPLETLGRGSYHPWVNGRMDARQWRAQERACQGTGRAGTARRAGGLT